MPLLPQRTNRWYTLFHLPSDAGSRRHWALCGAATARLPPAAGDSAAHARTLETKVIADNMQVWYDNLIAHIRGGTPELSTMPWGSRPSGRSMFQGVGRMEAPRGGLAHWTVIKDGRIANYQAVVPSTWNASPWDAAGQPGPYEAALVGHTLVDPKQPVEILRTIHSFDPCIACAVYLTDPNGKELIEVKVR